MSDNSHQLKIVAVYTRSLQGPISEAVPFALCAIRVDHDVAWWVTTSPSLQGEPIQNVGSLGLIRASLWCTLAASHDHAFLAAIDCLLFLASLKDLNFQTISPTLQLIFHCRACFATASIVIVTAVAQSRT
jgi:hypothetical protein